MLSKLFKVEFRATARLFLPMYALLLVMSVVTRLLYGISRDDAAGMNLTFLTVIVTVILVMLFTAVWVVTLVFIIRRFWTNQLGREGYLTNVLPVSPAQHLCAKSVTSLVWTLASVLAIAVALLILLGHVMNLALGIRDLPEFLRQLWDYAAQEQVTGGVVRFLIEAVCMMLLSAYLFILAVYAAMCIGQLANRHRVLASVGAYFGISTLGSILGNLLGSARMGIDLQTGFTGAGLIDRLAEVTTARETVGIVNNELLLAIGMAAAACAVLYVVSDLLLKKHLNLQ